MSAPSHARSHRGAIIAIVIALLAIGAIALVLALTGGSNKANANTDKYGAFNAAGTAATTLGEVGPGACLPEKTFNNPNGTAQVVKFLSSKDPRVPGVAARDLRWLQAHPTSYGYKPGQSDVDFMSGLVLKQLPYPIKVLNTYCPAGKPDVATWKVQTLPVGEWVWFMKGHAPGDGTTIVPVRKAVCGNWLLPPPPPAKTCVPSASNHNCGPSTPGCTTNCNTSPGCTTNCNTTPGCTTNCNTHPGCTTNCNTTPPGCGPCTNATAATSQPVAPPPAQPSSVPTREPSAQPTRPVNTNHPAPPTSGGNNGGSTSQPGTTAPPSQGPSETSSSDPGEF